MTKQRQYQLNRSANGQCQCCGKPLGKSKVYCDYHLEWKRDYQRRTLGWKPKKAGGVGRPALSRDRFFQIPVDQTEISS